MFGMWREKRSKRQHEKKKCNSSSITASNLLSETVEQKLNSLRHGTRKSLQKEKKFALVFFIFSYRKFHSWEVMASIWRFVSDPSSLSGGGRRSERHKTHKKLTLQVHTKKICTASKTWRNFKQNQFHSGHESLPHYPPPPLLFLLFVLRKTHTIRASSIVFYLWRHPAGRQRGRPKRKKY